MNSTHTDCFSTRVLSYQDLMALASSSDIETANLAEEALCKAPLDCISEFSYEFVLMQVGGFKSIVLNCDFDPQS